MEDAAHSLSEESRLEAALDRLARLRPAGSAAAPANAERRRELALRLDLLIADLRAVLGRDSAA